MGDRFQYISIQSSRKKGESKYSRDNNWRDDDWKFSKSNENYPAKESENQENPKQTLKRKENLHPHVSEWNYKMPKTKRIS